MPAARCLHRAGTIGVSVRETGRFTPVRVRHTIRNRWLTVLMLYQAGTLLRFAPALAAFEVLQFLGAVRKGWIGHWLWAAGSTVRLLPHVLRVRRAMRTSRRRRDLEVLTARSLSLQPEMAELRARARGAARARPDRRAQLARRGRPRPMTLGKIRRDLLIAFGSQLAFKVLGFVVLAVMARLLSQAEYGKLMFALTLCGVTVLVTDLGASTDLSRRVAAAPAGARRRLEAVLSARLPLIAAYLVLLPAWVAVTKPDALAVAAAIAVYSVCKDVYRTYSSLFQGLHRIGYTVWAFGASLVVLVVAVAAGALTGGGLAWMTGAHVLSGAVMLGMAAGIARRKIGSIRLRGAWRRMQRVFKESVWLFVLSVAGLVHFGADTVMLGYLQPYEQVARYQAAAKLLEASQFVVRPLTLDPAAGVRGARVPTAVGRPPPPDAQDVRRHGRPRRGGVGLRGPAGAADHPDRLHRHV